jgi:transcription elongation factor Elf1
MSGILRLLEAMSQLNNRSRVCLGLRFLVKIGRSCGLARQWLNQHESTATWLLDYFNQWIDELEDQSEQDQAVKNNIYEDMPSAEQQQKNADDQEEEEEPQSSLWGWLDVSMVRSQLIEMMSGSGQGGHFAGGSGKGVWGGYDSDDDPQCLIGHRINIKKPKLLSPASEVAPSSSSSLSSSSTTSSSSSSLNGKVIAYQGFAHTSGGHHLIYSEPNIRHVLDLSELCWEL